MIIEKYSLCFNSNKNGAMSSKQLHFFKDKPLFGLDIGHGSIKVMQLMVHMRKTSMVGYGTAEFDIQALDDGVIVDHKVIATAVRDLFQHRMQGTITARRVAMALPGYRTFSRSIQLPRLSSDELQGAVELEIEQYIPVPLDELYLDYTITSQTAKNCELFAVAVPKKIVDSYLLLAQMLGLETVLIEPTISACARFFSKDKHSGIPSIIVDFGSLTADMSIFSDTKANLANGTVPTGGLIFTKAIREQLKVTEEKAQLIKTKHGLGVSIYQKEVTEALEPELQKIVTEIRRMLRYYEERYSSKNHIGQIVMLGGGANMPGLGDYLTNALKVPVRTYNNPWGLFEHNNMQEPPQADRLMYATVAGLSLTNSKEALA